MTKGDIVAILLPIVSRLNEAEIEFVLVGGVAVPFYLPDELVGHVRPTKDVDVIVAAMKLHQFDRIEERLRRVGFVNHPEVRHRWLVDGALVDVMPVESDIMVTINRWYPATFRTAEPIEISEGVGVLIPSPACFLATKMEAFINRGRGDFLGSHDLEDFVTVIDGRDSLIEDIDRNCPIEVRDFLRATTGRLLANFSFLDVLEGYLAPGYRTEQRLRRLIERLEHLAR